MGRGNLMKNFYLKVPGLIRRSLLIFSVTFLLVVSFVTAWLWWNIPVDKSALPLVPARIVLLTREGAPFAAAGPRMRAPVAVEDLPPYVAQAFYAIEDRRFEYHFGVDPVGIGRALLNNLSGGGQQGGSTITQQLAKNVYLIDPETGAPYPGYARKLREIAIAFWLEAWLTKDQILERYLSNVLFGKNTYGLRAASLHYFYRQPEKLTLPQAIMLAGLVQAPSRYDPTRNEARARARAVRVSKAMQDAGYLPDGADNLPKIAELDIRIEPPLRTGFYFSDWVMDEARARIGQGYVENRIRTTLDGQLQITAQDVVRYQSPFGADVALVAMRPNGEVVAMIGGRDYARKQFNIAVSGRRQPGSTFKLFTYFTALQNGMRPETVISNAPITQGDYRPTNVNGNYGDTISLAKAFATSSNVAAVRLFEKVGANAVVDTARAFGVSSRMDMNSSLALGTSDASLLQMTAAYAAIAAGRARIDPIGLPRSAGPTSGYLIDEDLAAPLDPRALRDMRLMLARVITDGTGRAAQLPVPAYGKTGTTQNNRDAWFIGYAGELVVGVWLGNDSGATIAGMSGGEAAARLWQAFMLRAIAADRLTRPAAGADRVGAGKGTSGQIGAGGTGTSGPATNGASAPLVPGKLRGDDGQQIDLSRRAAPLREAGLLGGSRSSRVGTTGSGVAPGSAKAGKGTSGQAGTGTSGTSGPASRGAGAPSMPRQLRSDDGQQVDLSRRAPERNRIRVEPAQRRVGSPAPRPVAPVRDRPLRPRINSGDEDEDFTIECGDDSC
jgi:penicillin-binding protein 1A